MPWLIKCSIPLRGTPLRSVVMVKHLAYRHEATLPLLQLVLVLPHNAFARLDLREPIRLCISIEVIVPVYQRAPTHLTRRRGLTGDYAYLALFPALPPALAADAEPDSRPGSQTTHSEGLDQAGRREPRLSALMPVPVSVRVILKAYCGMTECVPESLHTGSADLALALAPARPHCWHLKLEQVEAIPHHLESINRCPYLPLPNHEAWRQESEEQQSHPPVMPFQGTSRRWGSALPHLGPTGGSRWR